MLDGMTVSNCPKCTPTDLPPPTSPAQSLSQLSLTECYHFESQNVFLSKSEPNFFGTIGANRIYLVYNNVTTSKISKSIEIYVAGNYGFLPHSNGKVLVEDDVHQSYRLERVIPLLLDHDETNNQDCDIVQVIYSNVADYFAFLLTSSSLTMLNNRRQSSIFARQSFVHVYTNYHLSNVHCVGDYLIRSNNQKISSILSKLNIIELKQFDNQQQLHQSTALVQSLNNASYIYSCPNTANLLITNNQSNLIFLFRMVRIQNEQLNGMKLIESNSQIDFIACLTIELSWIPKISKLVNNYFAFMSDEHFTLIQIDSDLLFDSVLDDSGLNPTSSPVSDNSGNCEERQIIYNALFDDLPPIETETTTTVGFKPMTFYAKSAPGEHAQTVYGPVGDKLACSANIISHRHSGIETPKTGSSSILFCRRLSKTPAIDLSNNNAAQLYCSDLVQSIKQKNCLWSNNSSSDLSTSGTDIKLLYSFQLLPYNYDGSKIANSLNSLEQIVAPQLNGTVTYAISLYLLWANHIDCYLVDLRRDTLRLIPVSYLNLNSNPTVINCVKLPDLSPVAKPSKSVNFFFKLSKKSNNKPQPLSQQPPQPSSCFRIKPIQVKDFSASPQNDLVHLLVLVEAGDGSFTTQLRTYSTDFLPLITSLPTLGKNEILDRTRPLLEMSKLSSRVFLNLIAAECNEQLLNLVSDGRADSSMPSEQHTIYGLRQPSIEQQQADLLTAIDDLRSNTECFDPNSHSLHQLYTRLSSITRFACQFPSPSTAYNRNRLDEFARKIESEIELLCQVNQANCLFRGCRFYRFHNNFVSIK